MALVMAVTAAVSAGTSIGPAARASAAAAPPPIVFGAAQAAAGGGTPQEAVTRLESSIGRRLAVVRIYQSWESEFPNPYLLWLRNTGHSVFLSIRPKRADGTAVQWAQIAGARPGSRLYAEMYQWAQSIKAFPGRMYLAFHHEPETTASDAYGTPAQFVAAWRRFVTVMKSAGVRNADFAWTVAQTNFFVPPTDERYAPRFYPGDAYVDDIAVDAYNMYCRRRDGHYQRPWRSMREVLAPLMPFARAHPGPGLMIAEWGSPEDPNVPGRKAAWIAEARQLFKEPGYRRFKAVLYWNQLSSNFANCDFRVSTSQSALDAFAAIANDPYYSAAVS